MELIRVLPEELPQGFCMAGMYAGEKRLQMAAYVPHLRVMADERMWNINTYMQRFHGFPYQRIGIDIFPMDYVPRDPELSQLQKKIVETGIALLRDWEQLHAVFRLPRMQTDRMRYGVSWMPCRRYTAGRKRTR